MGRELILGTCPLDPLPEHRVLERLLAVCFYASLLRDEDRPVRFRLIVGDPDRFKPEEGPPSGLHRLVFSKARACNEQELRRLSPSADFNRSLIGVRLDGRGGLLIWGLVHSGPGWLHDIDGARNSFSPLPSAVVVCVTDPGRLSVCRGPTTMASLRGTEIVCPSAEVFETEWFPQCFESTRSELWDLHLAAREASEKDWAELDPDIVRRIAQQVDRRVISTIRNSRHGGALIFLPWEHAADFTIENPHMTMRYQFAAEEPRNRFRTLIVKILNTLAEEFGTRTSPGHRVGWNEYLASRSETLSLLEEGIMEVAHLVAGLAAMDGAVVLTNKYELLGCGAEIACEHQPVQTVARALDAEATLTARIEADSFGSRHRSAYRLCQAFHDIIAIVISQDRSVRFIKWKDDAVTYWDQIATSVMDI